MNLYELHTEPESLIGYDISNEIIPSMAWWKYMNDDDELRKREWLWKHDAETAYLYAKVVLKDRFSAGEDVIAKNPHYSYVYAKNVIKGKFPKGESAIAQMAPYVYYYTKEVTHDRFLEGEPAIAKYAHYALLYAKNIIKGRFPEAEEEIATEPKIAEQYREFLRTLQQ